MDTLSLYNRSILAIPAYWGLCWATHAAAINIATGGKALKWDNRNPRASGLKEKLQKRLTPEVYAKYERCEAASANGFENLPLFATAVVLGNMAKLDQASLDKFAASYLVLRVIYFVSYTYTSKQEYTPIRSVLWISSALLSIGVIVQAAKVLN